jgi:hypothetical protein
MINPVLPRYALHLYLLDETVISVMIWTNGKPMLSVEGFRYELTNVQNERRMKVLLESAVVKGN